MMNNSDIVKAELEKLGAFSGKTNKYVNYMCNILGSDIPLSMRMNISNFSLASFIGHFHTKIDISGDLIPTNFIGFTLAKSGSAKTSSVNKLEKALGAGYHQIQVYREQKVEADAKKIAAELDDENWMKYKKKLYPLSNSLSTEAGMVKRLNIFSEEGLGLPSLFVDEVGSALATSPDIIPNIVLVSELFDAGNKKERALASEDNERAEVKGMGMSAMFIGSEHNVLLDEGVLKKFNDEFVTKLARRCFFNFPEFVSVEQQHKDIDSILNSHLEDEEYKIANADEIRLMSSEIANMLIENDINILQLTEKAERLYKIYMFHCKYESEKHTEEAVLLEQLHRHWKVLKLAGVYAIADLRMEISEVDIIEAISFAEMIDGELAKFIELSKRDYYEVLIDILKIEDELTVHQLKKKELITARGNPDTQINNLVALANSKLDRTGMVIYDGKVVKLDIFKKADEHGASFIQVSGTKEERSWKCKEGYTYKKTTFEKLANLLSNDTAYCAFEFTDGIRSNDNICSGATFIVLDIDNSDITWEEAHDMLGDYRHHIAKTSDNNNPYKFRAIIELDIEVDIEPRLWKNFMAKVGEHLGLTLDLLAKSQIYYGFKDREVLSELDGEPLPASEFVKTIDIEPKVHKKIPLAKLDDAFAERFETFSYAYECTGETGASFMYRAFRHAFDLGFTKEQTIALLRDICDYRGTDFDYIMKRTGMLNQINRAYPHAYNIGF